jgi:dipeptidyl aminopeptidase/acylaminoacyl peptidase
VPITSPPRPPLPSDPVTREDAEALIEEARQRARRRRQRNGAVAVAVSLGVVVLVTAMQLGAASTRTSAGLATDATSVGRASTQIAFIKDPLLESVFTEKDNELWVMNPDGTGQRRLTRIANFGPRLVARRADNHVRSRRRCSHPRHLRGERGRERPQRLTQGYDHGFAWSPDGGTIVFDGTRDGIEGSYAIDAGGTGQRRVAQGQQIEAAPTWSPDGQTLVYESSYRPSPSNPRLKYMWVSELFRVNVDGSGKGRLAYGAQPAWSPNGEQVLFVGRRHSTADLWIMNSDGSGQRQLTHTPGYGERTFAWSP